MIDKSTKDLKTPKEFKIKIPTFLPLALVTTTLYCESAIYLFKKVKESIRGTDEQKAVLRIYRRVLTDQLRDLRARNKALSQFCIIKAWIDQKTFFTPGDIDSIRLLCDYRDKKTFSKNLKMLESLDLIIERDGKYFVSSWEKVAQLFKHKHKFIRFKYVKPGNRIETVFTRIALEQKEMECFRAANLKLNNCTELKAEVKKISGKQSLSALNEVQELVTKNPTLSKAFDIDDYVLFKVCKGDTALSYRLWSALLGYKSIGGFAHVKRKLQKDGLIAVQKRSEVIARGNKIRYQNRSNCIGTMIFDKGSNQLILHKPDLLIYLSLNQKEKV